jgi:hypothetical protein
VPYKTLHLKTFRYHTSKDLNSTLWGFRTLKKSWTPPTHRTMLYLGGQRGVFWKVVLGFWNFWYDFCGKGNSADMCGRKFPLMSMGGRPEGLACADPGARTPIGMSRNSYNYTFNHFDSTTKHLEHIFILTVNLQTLSDT